MWISLFAVSLVIAITLSVAAMMMQPADAQAPMWR
jgi:hypothetical protein